MYVCTYPSKILHYASLDDTGAEGETTGQSFTNRVTSRNYRKQGTQGSRERRNWNHFPAESQKLGIKTPILRLIIVR